jgi:hypothetical protein
MSNLLQKCFGRDDLQPGKGQLSAAQIAHIAVDDEVCSGAPAATANSIRWS